MTEVNQMPEREWADVQEPIAFPLAIRNPYGDSVIIDGEGNYFAAVHGGRAQNTHRAFIVHACNVHEELLAAAKATHKWLNDNALSAPLELRRAIAKAEGR